MADIAPTLPTDLSTAPEGVSLTPSPAAIAETGAALDALFAAQPGVEGTPPVTPPVVTPPVTPPVTPVTPPVTPPVPPVKPTAEGTPPVTPPVVTPPVKDDFDKVELPPHTKPAVAESFENLKKVSRERVSAIEKEREELRTKLAEAQAKPAVDPVLEAELKELREFRQKLDVEADPSFKEFVEEIKTNDESIFSKLKEAGASDDVLTQMRTIGTKDLAWDAILEKLPPVARRYVENKLAVNDDLSERRTRAIDSAKKNASEFLANREKENTQGEIAHFAAAEQHFGKVSVQLPWFKLEKIEATATPEEKAEIEARNKFFTETQKSVKEILADSSPEMRAVAAVGYAQMLRLQAEIPAINAEHTAATKVLTDEIAALKAQLKEKEDFITRVKASSKTSLREGNAPTNLSAAASQPTGNESGSSAVDRLRAEQLATT